MINKELISQNKKTTLIGAIALLALVFLTAKSITSKPQTPEVKVSMNRHTQQVVQFFTKVIGSQKKTKVYIPFSFERNTFFLLLGYKTNSGLMKEFTIYHPEISQLFWPQIREGGITLFQKKETFKSVGEFLKNPTGKILAEESIKNAVPQLKNASIIQDSNNIDQFDFVISTQVPLRAVGNTFYYENQIDTSDAMLDESGQITWVVRAPDANEQNVFYLGNIDITYLQ